MVSPVTSEKTSITQIFAKTTAQVYESSRKDSAYLRKYNKKSPGK
jgi:hypothetical protein